jgi:REP element-mobilizing transposase RayT
MSNHFHLVVETPRANLVAGMKWLLGSYTMRFNRRHRLSGHLFAGRYKSLLIVRSLFNEFVEGRTTPYTKASYIFRF